MNSSQFKTTTFEQEFTDINDLYEAEKESIQYQETIVEKIKTILSWFIQWKASKLQKDRTVNTKYVSDMYNNILQQELTDKLKEIDDMTLTLYNYSLELKKHSVSFISHLISEKIVKDKRILDGLIVNVLIDSELPMQRLITDNNCYILDRFSKLATIANMSEFKRNCMDSLIDEVLYDIECKLRQYLIKTKDNLLSMLYGSNFIKAIIEDIGRGHSNISKTQHVHHGLYG